MNKEDILLKNYGILAKNPTINADALEALILQLCEIAPELAIRCWSDLLKNNIKELEGYFYSEEYPYDNLGYKIVRDFETNLVGEDYFKYALSYFSKNKQLLEIFYSKSPISDYADVYYAIAYLIRNEKLNEANTILTAIYKNKTYANYSSLWKNIVNRFRYSDIDNYCGGGLVSDSNYKQSKEVQDFCLSWVERIIDEEQQAGAMTHIMRIF